MILPESLLLLAVAGDPGSAPRGGYRLDLALAGAELIETAFAGRLDVRAGRLAAIDDLPDGDSDLDGIIDALFGLTRPITARDWLASRHRQVRAVYLDRLCCSQVIRRQERRVLGIFRVNGYPLCDPDVYDHTFKELDEVAVAPTRPGHDPDTAALGALAHLSGLARALYPGRSGRPGRAGLRQLTQAAWAPATVAALLGAVSSAIESEIAAATNACR
jgi:hypothetical protein